MQIENDYDKEVYDGDASYDPRSGCLRRAPASCSSGQARVRIIRAGLPAATLPGGRSRGTMLPAPTTLPSPIVTPGRMMAPPPIHTPSPSG